MATQLAMTTTLEPHDNATTLWSYVDEDDVESLSRPERFIVRYKSSIMTKIGIVILVLYDLNFSHKHSH